MSAVRDSHSTAQRTASMLQQFSRPAQDSLYRAYDHLIAVRLGMTLMVPVAVSAGKLVPVVDRCPVPWLEATAILAADYATAAPLSLVSLVEHAQSIKTPASPLGRFAQAVLESFIGSESEYAVALSDKEWRHVPITLTQGCQPCRVFVGAAGVRFAFTPDFLEGVL